MSFLVEQKVLVGKDAVPSPEYKGMLNAEQTFEE